MNIRVDRSLFEELLDDAAELQAERDWYKFANAACRGECSNRAARIARAEAALARADKEGICPKT